MDNSAKPWLTSQLDLGPALSSWTCLLTTMIYLMLGSLLTCPAHLIPVVWVKCWLERPCPGRPVIMLSWWHQGWHQLMTSSGIPQGATSTYCTWQHTTELEPVFWQQRKPTTSCSVLTGAHPVDKGKKSSLTPHSLHISGNLCPVLLPSSQKIVNWNELSGLIAGRCAVRAVAPWEEAERVKFFSLEQKWLQGHQAAAWK